LEIESEFGSQKKDTIVQDASTIWYSLVEAFEVEDKFQRDDLSVIESISIALTMLIPHFFVPYFFIDQFIRIEEICEIFNLNLPEIPKVTDYKARFNYYLEICLLFYTLREEYDLKPEELFAIIYGFSGNISKSEFDFDAKPLNVWFTLGSPTDYDFFYNNYRTNDITFWAVHSKVKPGDILLIYIWGKKILCGISKILTEGYFDPFSIYAHRAIVKISSFIPEEIAISFSDLKGNHIWNSNSLVKAHMQGVKGRQITVPEYLELIKIWKEKNPGINFFPPLAHH